MLSASDITDHLFNYGALGALVAFAMLCSWRIGKFVSPLITKAFASHIDLMDTLKEGNKRHLQIEETQTELLSALSQDVQIVKRHVVKDVPQPQAPLPQGVQQ